MARTPSAMDAPFHPDIGFLAQRRRGLVRNPHKAQAQARRLSLRRRPASRDQPLPRRAQSAIEGLHLDRQSRRNHRRTQARAPSVRFDPLGAEIPEFLIDEDERRRVQDLDGLAGTWLRHKLRDLKDFEALPPQARQLLDNQVAQIEPLIDSVSGSAYGARPQPAVATP